MTNEARFVKLQAKVLAVQAIEEQYRRALQAQYQETWWAPAGKAARLRALETRSSVANDAFYAFLASISPRDWTTTIPSHWIVEHLTYDMAISRDALPEPLPSPAYGYTTYDVRRKWAAIAA